MSRPFCHLLMRGSVSGLLAVGRLLAAVESCQSRGRMSGLQFAGRPGEWFFGGLGGIPLGRSDWDGLGWVGWSGVGFGLIGLWCSGVGCVVFDWICRDQCKDVFSWHTLPTSARLHVYAQIW